jgi:hypothetical protein
MDWTQAIAILKEWYPVILQVVGVAAVIATMTANKADNKIVDFILKVINVIGMNFGLANNKED